MKNTARISRETALSAVQAELYEAVGYGKELSFKQLSERTGIAESRLYKIRYGEITPGIDELLLLARAIGPRLGNRLFGLVGQGGLHEIGPAPTPASAMKVASLLAARIAEQMAAGSVDHRGILKIKRAAASAAPEIAALARAA